MFLALTIVCVRLRIEYDMSEQQLILLSILTIKKKSVINY